jgi:hypothetical protein
MFALVETWFSSLSTTCVPAPGRTHTRAARAIASCVRSTVAAMTSSPALLRPLQLLFACCISGRNDVSKAIRIQAAARLGIESARDGGADAAPPDAAVFGDANHTFAFEFLFLSEL